MTDDNRPMLTLITDDAPTEPQLFLFVPHDDRPPFLVRV